MIYYQPHEKAKFKFTIVTRRNREPQIFYAAYLESIFFYIREAVIDDEGDGELIELKIEQLKGA